MASKVNVKFVVMLSVVLGVLFVGVATVAFFVLTHSGAELEATGDQLMKEGDYKNAITYYGKSFNDDQTNINRLTKYVGAMLAYTPENQALYNDYYWKRLIPAMMVRANLLKGDVAAQEEVLDILSRNMYESGFSRRGWEQVVELTSAALVAFESGAVAPGWERLKRYRGLALLEIATGGVELDEKQAIQIEADLQAALAADPDDERSAMGLVSWYSILAGKEVARSSTTGEAEFRAKALGALESFRGAHPDSVLAAITDISLKVEAAARAADPKKFKPEQRLKMMRDAGAVLEPQLVAAFELARKLPPDKRDASMLYRLNRLERYIRNNADNDSQALIDQTIGAKPGAADLRFLRGRLSEDRGLKEEAITQYQALLALPVPPLSLEGVLLYEQRLAAMGRQAEAAMALWESISADPKEGEDKAAATARYQQERAATLKRVVDFKEQLAKEVPPTSLGLMLIEAKLAYAQGNLPEAKQKLDEHVRQTSESDSDSVRLSGIVAMQMNQPGIARDKFKRLTELEPNSPRAWLLLADAEGTLDNHEDAKTAYEEALALDPENAYAKEKVQQLTTLIGGASEDPVVQAMLDFDKYWNGRGAIPDRDQAIIILEKCVADHPADIRPLNALASAYNATGRAEDAKAICRRGLELAKTDTEARPFRNILLFLEAPDPFTAGMALIDDSPMLPADKLIAKYRLAVQNGRAEEAKQFLDEAARLAPDSPAVIELRFSDALSGKRMEEAATLADTAAAAGKNGLDGVKGATYRSRLLVVQGKMPEAIDVLRAATQSGAATPEIWRFLGQVQADAGRPEDALVSFNESLRMRPNDVGTILDTLRTLIRLERYDEALNLARASEPHARASAEYRDLWFRLEASVGNKSFVIIQRRAILKQQPDNDVNKLALLQTDVEVGEWAEARTLLDDLRKKQDTLLLVQLDAQWHAGQGDRDGARRIYLDFIAAQKAAGIAPSPEPYVAMARFLMGVGDVQNGLATLEEARKFQDPKLLDVDKTLGVILFELGQFEQALPVFEGILAAEVPDEGFSIRSRHVEALIRLKRFADAESSINAAGPEAGGTLTLLILRAGARQGQDDVPGALRLINEAISKYPNDPLGYVKRAELTSTSAEALNDAVADLDTAIRLRPTMWNALQLRALIKIRQNRTEEAMDDLRGVVKLQPQIEGPRTALLQTLIETGEFQEAFNVANAAANQRPRDVPLLMNLGDLFNNYSTAVPQALEAAQSFYKRAWELGPNPKVAVIYTRALLRTRNANLDLIKQILDVPEINTAGDPQLLMNHAVLLSRQGATDRSRIEAAQALKLVINNPGDTSLMLDQLGPVFGDPNGNSSDMAALVAFVQSVDMTGLPDLWPDFFRARFKVLDPKGGREDGINSLRRVVANAQDKSLQRVARQFLSAALIGSGDRENAQGNAAAALALYEESVTVIKGAIDLDPTNSEALNNAAYVLTANLKRPAEALPLSESAVQQMPNSGPYLDTLGLIYLELGRFADADKALNRAIAAGGSIDERLQIAMKLIRVKIGLKDAAAAQKITDDANKATGRDPNLKARYQAELDQLQKDIDAVK